MSKEKGADKNLLHEDVYEWERLEEDELMDSIKEEVLNDLKDY